MNMNLVCLDLEGVLLPECWIAVAEATGLDALRRTTREEPDYDALMRYRLDILHQHGLTLPALSEVIEKLEPLPGAIEFTHWLMARTRLIILSDTFTQFAAPLMRKLGHPTLFCHELEVAPDGAITGYRLRQEDQKRRAVRAFQSLNFRVLAAGDSYNDLNMLQSADEGILFRPTEAFAAANPRFPVTRTHEELRSVLEKHLSS
jgi:phosphoserine / homoserine phosphotransferase